MWLVHKIIKEIFVILFCIKSLESHVFFWLQYISIQVANFHQKYLTLWNIWKSRFANQSCSKDTKIIPIIELSVGF